MSENKRFYWLKINENFFDDDTISWIEEQENGKEYCLFYLKLCLKSLKTGGLLIRNVGELLIPYDIKKLAEITKTELDTAIVAMEIFKKIGLVQILDNGEIFLTQLSEMVGSETDKAKAMRAKRARDRLEKEGNIVTPMLPEKEKEKEIEQEKETDINIDPEKEKKNNIDQEFAALWALYPRKVGKDKARKVYQKERKKNPALFQTVEAGIKAYIDYIAKKKIEPEYIKHGSTWFNQKGWEDNYIVEGVTNGNSRGSDEEPESIKRWGNIGTVL